MFDLKAEAARFNSQYEGVADEIAAGTPIVDVDFQISSTTYRMTVVVTPGVLLEDGSVAAAFEPLVFEPFEPFDRRDYLKSVRWAMRKVEFASEIPAGTPYRIRPAGKTHARETGTW